MPLFSAMSEKAERHLAQSILDAATALVRRLGEGKTNMVDIGKALGVSHAALYRFFPSKAAVMDAIVQEAMTKRRNLRGSGWTPRAGCRTPVADGARHPLSQTRAVYRRPGNS